MHIKNVGGIALLALLLAASGCGGSSTKSNGVASKSADAIVAAALRASNSAKSVHVSGTINEGGQPLVLDLRITRRGGSGRLVENGAGCDIVRIGSKAYMRGSAAFWRSVGGKAAAQIFAGRWISASATSGDLAALTPLTDMRQFVGEMLRKHGKLAKAGTKRIGGQPVIAVKDTEQDGTLYIATTGQPYPVELEQTGSSKGRLRFDHWDAAVTLTPPKNAIDSNKLTH